MGDILNVNWTYLNTPRSAKGYGQNDFIWFQVATPNLRPESLHVFTTDSSEIYDARCLGRLSSCIKVPNIVYPPYSKVIVTGLNTNGQKVEFHGTLKRGAKYLLSTSAPGKHDLPAIISTENCGCCNYNTSY